MAWLNSIVEGLFSGSAVSRARKSRAALEQILTLNAPDQVEEGISACDQLIARLRADSTWQMREVAADVLLHKALLLRKYEKAEEAVSVYEEVVALLADRPEPVFRHKIAKTLEEKRLLCRFIAGAETKLIKAHDDLIKFYSESSQEGSEANLAGVLLDKIGLLRNSARPAYWLRQYDEFDRRFSPSHAPGVRLQTANGLAYKRGYLNQIGRKHEAGIVFRQMMERYRGDPDPAMQAWLDEKLAFRATFHEKKEAKLAGLQQSLETLRLTGDPTLRIDAAQGLLESAFAIDLAPRIEILDQLFSLFSEAAEPEIRVAIAKAYTCKSGTLGRLGRIDEQELFFEEFLRRFSDAPEPEIRAHLATALLWRTRSPFVKQGESADTAADNAIARFTAETHPLIELAVAEAMQGRATALEKAGRKDEALTICNALIARYSASSDEKTQIQVLIGLSRKAQLLKSLARIEESIAPNREIVARFSAATNQTTLQSVRQSLLAVAKALAELRRPAEAIAALDEVLQFELMNPSINGPHRTFAEAYLCKAEMLELIGREKDAAVLYRQILELGPETRGSVLWLLPYVKITRQALARLANARHRFNNSPTQPSAEN